MRSIEEIVQEVRAEGLSLLPNVFSKEACREYVSILDDLVAGLPEDNAQRVNPDVQSINNYFRHDPKLLELIYIPLLDDVLKVLLDQDHVLIAGNTFNRCRRPDIRQNRDNPNSQNAGHDWHVDSRYLGGQRMEAGLSFQIVIMLEDFTAENGATRYVPLSHLCRDRPDREGDYEFQLIEGEAGTIGIMDSGMWHRSGPVGDHSRWGAFNLYGPWFMKPYFRFPEMLGEERGKTFSPELRRLFHYRSTPPLDEQD